MKSVCISLQKKIKNLTAQNCAVKKLKLLHKKGVDENE